MEIIKKIYLRNLKMNILIIVLFTAMIFAVNIELAQLIQSYSYKTQITDFPSNYYYLSISNSFLDNLKSNEELINTVLNTGEVTSIGNYELKNAYLDNNPCKVYELNSVMQNIEYQLSDGNWFTDENNCQLILGGDIAEKYNIGDLINIVGDNGQNYQGQVIGKLKTPAYLMHLNYAQCNQTEDLTFKQLLYSYYDNICLVNQYTGNVSDLSIKCAWILKGNSNFKESDFDSLGGAVSLTQIKKNTSQEFQMKIFQSTTYFILLLSLFVICVLSMSYITIEKEMDFILICKICGAQLKDLVKILFGIYLFNIISSVLIFFSLQIQNKTFNIHNLGVNSIIYGNILLIIIYIVVTGLIQIIYTYFLLKKSFREMKRRA